MKRGLIQYSVLLVGLVAALPVSAHFFDSYQLFYGEWAPARYVHFGGCEADDSTACIDGDNSEHGSFFNLGELDVKQGVYSVETVGDSHGKIVMNYSYRYYTEEPADDTTDKGIIKVKDVDTNELYYYRELHAADMSDEWVDVRAILPRIASGRKVQLVLEVENDGVDVSRMHIDAVGVQHINTKAQVKGRVFQKVTGKYAGVADATVVLKNRSLTKTYQETVTDAEGHFTFFPVQTKRRMTIVVTSDVYGSKAVNIGKLRRSDYLSFNVSLTDN